MNYYKAEIDDLLITKNKMVDYHKSKLDIAIKDSESAHEFFDNVVDSYQGD